MTHSEPDGSASRAGQQDYVLPTALEPHEDESLPGLLMRNAELFRFHDPQRLLRRLRLPKLIMGTRCREDPAGEAGRQIRILLKLDDATFRRMSLWADDPNELSILGQPVWRELVRPEVRAVCPLCLEDSGHHRAIWLTDMLPACARHGTLLLRRCPDCSRLLGWSGKHVWRCSSMRCRHDLRRAKPEPLSPDRLSAIVALDRLLHEGTAGGGHLRLPFGAALLLSVELGKLAYRIEKRSRPPALLAREGNRLPEILNAGWAALDDWPHGFTRLLDTLKSRETERAGIGGLRKAFGSLSKKVYDWAREPWGAPIGEAFAQYGAEQPDLATTARMLRRYAPGAEIRHRFVSMSEAKRELGIAPGSMIAIANRLDLYALAPQGGGLPSLIRADHVVELKAELARTLSVQEARAILGVARFVMEQLEQAGLFTCIPLEQRLMESRLYRRAEVENLVQRCVGNAPRMSREQAKKARLTPLANAVGPGRAMADMCRALRDGRLVSAATVTEAKGLASIRMVMDEVSAELPAVLTTMSLRDAGKRLAIRHSDLQVWARRGLLETRKGERKGEVGARLNEADLARFQQAYMTGGELCRILEQQLNHWLGRRLQRLGVEAVGGPGVDGAKTALFRRADCTDEVLRRVAAGWHRPPGTPQEKHRRAFSRALQVAATVARLWGVSFSRMNNRFSDEAGGRTLQVISGRRPDLTGVYRFGLTGMSAVRLRGMRNVWIALVPASGPHFVLLPFEDAPWRGNDVSMRYVTLRFDNDEMPLELAEHALLIDENQQSLEKPLPEDGARTSRGEGGP